MAKLRSKPAHPANRLRQVAWWAPNAGNVNELFTGVLNYITEHQGWSVHQMWEHAEADWPAWLGDGVIVCGNPMSIAPLIEKMPIPVVLMYADQLMPSFSSVNDDQMAVGGLAAEHLFERGLTHFGFCGSKGWPYSDGRRDGFKERLQRAGFACTEYDNPAIPVEHPQSDAIAQWLATLPKPIGIMSDCTFRGRELLAACRQQQLDVPDQVALITVKTQGDGSQLEIPPLSSVRLNTLRLGYETAALLDRLMAEQPGRMSPANLVIAPLGVETRQSSDMLAIPDPHVAEAVRFIWRKACEGIRVSEVLQAFPETRNGIEQRFHKLVGRTIHEELIRVRIKRAKELLTGTNLPLKQIASDSGFTRFEYFATVFQQMTGTSPSKYRHQSSGI